MQIVHKYTLKVVFLNKKNIFIILLFFYNIVRSVNVYLCTKIKKPPIKVALITN